MRHPRSLVAVSFACALSWGCGSTYTPNPVQPTGVIVDSGKVATESRPVSGFSAVSVGGAGRLVIVQSGVESLSVTADENILPFVRSEVVGGRLVLGLAPNTVISTTREIVFEVSARALSSVEATGATRVELSGIDTQTFSLEVAGAAQVTGSGTAGHMLLNLAGDVRCELDRLVSRSAVATVSGASYARLRVADSLTATVSGMSLVEYYGNPVLITNVSGASAVRRLGSY